ncbi:hypothetical protein [Nocardia vinacea]|uniref:hypothetical protein n=1 Tax=Nocardia vinacea TaxID=96468 RepID=UPI0002F11E2B|nr:hypothetical protein [Nocardia vinacea]
MAITPTATMRPFGSGLAKNDGRSAPGDDCDVAVAAMYVIEYVRVLLLRGRGDCVGASARWQRLVLWSCHAVLLGVVLGPIWSSARRPLFVNGVVESSWHGT